MNNQDVAIEQLTEVLEVVTRMTEDVKAARERGETPNAIRINPAMLTMIGLCRRIVAVVDR